jgi:hypothetical protein
MECLRLAERAGAQEDRTVLLGLARAWVLLGEQVKHLHEENHSDLESCL